VREKGRDKSKQKKINHDVLKYQGDVGPQVLVMVALRRRNMFVMVLASSNTMIWNPESALKGT
jgi:hypothetical protein